MGLDRAWVIFVSKFLVRVLTRDFVERVGFVLDRGPGRLDFLGGAPRICLDEIGVRDLWVWIKSCSVYCFGFIGGVVIFLRSTFVSPF